MPFFTTTAAGGSPPTDTSVNSSFSETARYSGTLSNGAALRTSNSSEPLTSGSSTSLSTSLHGPSSTRTRKTRTIVILGFSMVGKTALCHRFVNDRFEEAYEPTYSASFLKLFHHRQSPIECIIKDTQGLGEQELFRSEYGLGVHGYVLVYSIASSRSFDVIQSLNAKLVNLIGSGNIPRILIGTKSDVGDDMRQVTYAQGAALAQRWGCPFTECSSKFGIGVDKAFTLLLDEIERASEPERPAFTTSIGNALERLVAKCTPFCPSSSALVSSPTSSLLSPDSPAVLDAAADAPSTDRWTIAAKLSTFMTFALTLCGMTFAIWLGLTTHESQLQLFAYILFAFAFIVWLVSLIGVYALRTSSIEFLQVYGISLGILAVCEVVTWAVLYTNLHTFARHRALVICLGLASVLIQAFACLAAMRLIHVLNYASIAGTGSSSAVGSTNGMLPPYLGRLNEHSYHQTYHSLYE